MAKDKKPNPNNILDMIHFAQQKKAEFFAGKEPLAPISQDELTAFGVLRDVLATSKLIPNLGSKKDGGSDFVPAEELVKAAYPDCTPDDLLEAKSLTDIDAFIYVYDGIVGARKPIVIKNPGDFRNLMNAEGFREMFAELEKACRIHKFCSEHVGTTTKEPITGEIVSEARKLAFGYMGKSKEVMALMAKDIRVEIDNGSTPVHEKALKFAGDFKDALEPLQKMGKEIKGTTGKPGK